MSDYHPTELDLDDAGSLITPNDIVQENRVLRAAFNHLTSLIGRATLTLVGMQVDGCPAVEVTPLAGRAWRLTVDRPVQNTES